MQRTRASDTPPFGNQFPVVVVTACALLDVQLRIMNASIALAASVTPSRGRRWLRNGRFDVTLVVGAPAVGMATGLFVSAWPEWFVPILILDLWFLGYHHVIATYTRLCFDRQSWRHSRFLVIGLLPMVAVATTAVAWIVGLWVIASVSFYWQWFHYARQSWGVSRSASGPFETLMRNGWVGVDLFSSSRAISLPRTCSMQG